MIPAHSMSLKLLAVAACRWWRTPARAEVRRCLREVTIRVE
ncbi:MAG TPA: hypothetical protein VH680_04345 [Gemmatimonadales bacterium]|jgi:hypothetical protein